MLNWEKFASLFHESWHRHMQKFVESEECEKIYEFLKQQTGRGKKIAPLSQNVFRCFKETPYDEIKVILVGLSPYHTIYNKTIVADGLLFGCSETGRLQPSLDQFYSALEKDVYNGVELHYEKTPDVSYLAHQGVLMLNASLTTELLKAGSHLLVWEPFMKYLFEKVLDTSGAPIIFLGKEAAKLEKYTGIMKWIFKLSHPASAAYSGADWSSEKVFTQVNKILKGSNNTEIQWLKVL